MIELPKSLLNRLPKISGMTLILSGPLVAMSWHIYEIYDTDIFVVRVTLAISFDLIIIALYRYLTDKKITNDTVGYYALWFTVFVVAVFQIYVNVTAYMKDATLLSAFAKGAIFPFLVNMVAFVDARRTDSYKQDEVRKLKKLERSAEPIQPGSPRYKSLPVEEVEGVNLTREDVMKWIEKGFKADQLRKASNWRSIQRWVENGKI